MRGGLDLAIEVLLVGERLAELLDRREHVAALSNRESAALAALGSSVRAALDTEAGNAGSLGACAEGIIDAADRVVGRFVESTETRLKTELAAIDRELAGQRAAAGAALDRMLLKYPMPGVRSRIQLTIAGERYEARLSQSSDLGIAWTSELEVPPDHLMANALRVDRALEKLGLPKLVVRTPVEGGMFRKRVKWTPQRLGKECIAAVTRAEESMKIQLREGPDLDQPGFDIAIQGAASRVLVKPVGRDDGAETFEPEFDDADRLVQFGRALASQVDDLRGHQSAIVESRFDGTRYATCEQPTDLVRRLLGAMAPVVREIAKRSPGGQELVLKRLIGDDRREELFVSFEELRHKLERLPPALRREFSIFPFYRNVSMSEISDEDEVTVERAGAVPAIESGRAAAVKVGKPS